ncbi:MAG: MotA/TolQ/ExbB proton channel family protein [Oleiphilaceae bacterium]|nr:MotA/TolQ/ExbB proton channel family protein [Oleiphilaceae bacterium]
MKQALLATLILMCFALPTTAQESGSDSLKELLELVREGSARDASEQQARLRRFIEERNEQDQRLGQARAELAELEKKIAEAEASFDDNEEEITTLEKRLDESSGELKELFGVLQQVGGDVRSSLVNSPTSAQYPGRGDFLQTLIEKAGSSSQLPSIREMEKLWYFMQEEMIASGTNQRFTAPVVDANGNTEAREVVRAGTFNVLDGQGNYLNWEADTQKLVVLARQPAGRYLDTAAEFVNAEPGEMADLWVDPSGGSLLTLLLQAPDLRERIDQGGLIGYIILALGLFALLLALERLISLGLMTVKVNQQARSSTPNSNNPLGRVMQTYQENRHKDSETLELKLGESIARETPRLTRFLAVLKIIAVVAPLLGLLGTVTGMINTFQAITLFGTGDPKLMAGGISQALVTTVMGLAVAIPTVLLHTLVQGRSKRLSQLLEERSIGIIAGREEQDESGDAGNSQTQPA